MKSYVRVNGSPASAVVDVLKKRHSLISGVIVKAWRDAVRSSNLSERAKNRYCKAITPYKKSDVVGAYIKDFVAVLLEKGWKRFDMKPGLLKRHSVRRIPLDEGKTFRTVSHASRPDSWIHPGFRGAQVIGLVKSSVDRLVKQALEG